ncbi:hypothetical protein WJX81_005250 [Elliptochloris bilobata]|uniref:C3H1-type domain-containing protein n=1 Tax=Elliptochloris bilobata TaxID=381761 RepID=A0AAW1RNK1_9CHLO
MKGNKEARKEHDDDEGALLNSVEFKIHCMKVLPCSKRFCHDWTVCPFAHPGEKARRRDPRLFTYTGIACPDMKKDQSCLRGDACPYAHNVFEYWLHPTRYRTQLCNDGPNCTRRICFFAHSLEELRVPANKPFVPPEALAAASVSAALKAAEKAAAASSEASLAKGGRGSKEESGQGASSADLAKQLAALQVAASTPSGSRTAQEERRVVEVLSALLRTYESAPAEGASGHGSSPSRRASCDLPVHPRTQQQRGNGGSSSGVGDDRLPLGQGRNNSDPAHGRGRGGRSRSSNAQTRRSLDYGMQRALMAHTVDENAQFLQPMAEGNPLGLPATSQGVPAFSPAELASAWAAANAARASGAPNPNPMRDWAPAPDFHQAQQQQTALAQAALHAQAGVLAVAEAQQRAARGSEGVASPFAGAALGEHGTGGGLAWPWEQLEGMDAARRQSTDSSRLSVDTNYRMSGDYAPSGADFSARASFESMQGVAGHDLGDLARTFDASQRYSADCMRSGTPPATPGAYGGNFGSLFAFSGPYGASQPPARDLGGGGWGVNPSSDAADINPTASG